MSLLKNTSAWISLFAATSLFSENTQCAPVCTEPSQPPCQKEFVAACCPTGKGCWDLFATGSFIYWTPYQDNMELGIVSPPSDSSYALHGNVVNFDSNYTPGFQIGIGTNCHQETRDIYLQYTWFHGNQNTDVSLSSTGSHVLFPMWETPDASQATYFNGKEDWRLHMDLLDLEFGKHYCVAADLSFRPFYGLRAAWIRQNVEVDYTHEATGVLGSPNVSITQRSHSWALGLRGGLSTNWMFCKSFRIYGSGNGDLLFAQYTNLRWHQEGIAPGALYTVRQHNLNCLRGHLDLELGLGWGTSFANHKKYVDLSASYGFQVFFNQNMFRNFVDDQALAKSISPNGDLYIHGLTATVRLDF